MAKNSGSLDYGIGHFVWSFLINFSEFYKYMAKKSRNEHLKKLRCLSCDKFHSILKYRKKWTINNFKIIQIRKDKAAPQNSKLQKALSQFMAVEYREASSVLLGT